MVRYKNRYLIMEIHSNNERKLQPHIPLNTTSYAITKSLLKVVEKIHGDFGCAAVTPGLCTKYCNDYTRVTLVRVRRGPHKLLASAIPFLTDLDGKKVTINTLYKGATIKHCVQFIKSYQKKKIETDLVTFKDKPEYEKLCELYRNINPAYSLH